MQTRLDLLACLAAVVIVSGCTPATASPPASGTDRAPEYPASTNAAASVQAATPPASAGLGQQSPRVSTTFLQRDSIATVVDGPVRVRSRPRIAADSRKFDPLLPTGANVFVIDGPQRGSDYDWYLVRTLGQETHDGWVAVADHDGAPWLEPGTASCVADPTLDQLARMEGTLRVFCYSAQTFTFTDSLSWGPMCGDGNILASPAWMASCWTSFAWGSAGGVDAGAALAITPDLLDAAGPREGEDSFEATVVAHLDDPAARTCEPYTGLPEADYELLKVSVVLDCRATFVASSLVRLDP